MAKDIDFNNDEDENIGGLFDTPQLIPPDIKAILDTFEDESYGECGRVQNEIEARGYTFDWYLDADPYNLRKLEPKSDLITPKLSFLGVESVLEKELEILQESNFGLNAEVIFYDNEKISFFNLKKLHWLIPGSSEASQKLVAFKSDIHACSFTYSTSTVKYIKLSVAEKAYPSICAFQPLIGYQVATLEGQFHEGMDASFCVYSLAQATQMRGDDPLYVVHPIYDGDIEDPTIMFFNHPNTNTYTFEQIKQALINLVANDSLPVDMRLLTEDALFPRMVVFQLLDRFDRQVGLVRVESTKEEMEDWWVQFNRERTPEPGEDFVGSFVDELKDSGFMAERYFETETSEKAEFNIRAV